MTKVLPLSLWAAVMFICASAAIAQDVRFSADRLESDAASGAQLNELCASKDHLAYPRSCAAHMGRAARV